MWPFQITLTGALAFGLVHLLLADRDGQLVRRDLLGLLFGLAAVMSSGVGLVMLVAVGAAALLRRGLRVAVFHTAPPVLVFLIWRALFDESRELKHAAIVAMPDWVLEQAGFVLEAMLGSLALGAVVFSAVAVGWWLFYREVGTAGFIPTAALPLELAVAALAMALFTWWGRGVLPSEANASRYVYVQVAMLLPALALGLFSVVKRSALGVVFLVPLVVLVPLRLPELEPAQFDLGLSTYTKQLVTELGATPLLKQVPTWVHPSKNWAIAGPVTVGWLLEASSQGRLSLASAPAPTGIGDQIRLDLGVASPPTTVAGRFPDCELIVPGSTSVLRPEVGDEFRLKFGANGADVGMLDSGGRPLASSRIWNPPLEQALEVLESQDWERTLRINLPDMKLKIPPADGPGPPESVEICRSRR